RTAGLTPGVRRLGIQPGDGAQPKSLEAFAATLAKQPLIADPGTEWAYSVSIDLLGAIIQKVSGQPLETFLEERIFTPLGMEDTGFIVPKADSDRLTTNYIVAGAMPLPFPLPVADGTLVPIDGPPNSEYNDPAPYPSGGGGLASTGEDYIAFMRAVANGGMFEGRQVLPRAAIDMAVSNLLPDGVSYGTEGIADVGGGSEGYGAGGRVSLNEGPLNSYGWGGAAGTLASALPEIGTGVVLMTQYFPQQAYPLPREFREALVADTTAAMTASAN
ncbi:MAG: serine hydrolase domain-containing protein, partial [Pacificimonas sp.]